MRFRRRQIWKDSPIHCDEAKAGAYRLALLELVVQLLGLLLRVAALLDLDRQLVPLRPEGLLQHRTVLGTDWTRESWPEPHPVSWRVCAFHPTVPTMLTITNHMR